MPNRNSDVATTLPPIAVGGVGGSGTRLVSQLLRDAGIFMGDDLNEAGDNLWFTLLFKHDAILEASDERFDRLLESFLSAMTGGEPLPLESIAIIDSLAGEDRAQHGSGWLMQRRETLLAAAASRSSHRRWGWKEPNTHVVIERVWERLPDLRYIHVVRHGLDMAYSRNQNQLCLWGKHALGRECAITPANSLAYWCRIQKRMETLLSGNRHRMHWLDYDELCANPDPALDELAEFLSIERNEFPSLSTRISRPPHRHHGWRADGFSASDIEYVRSLGYAIDCRE